MGFEFNPLFWFLCGSCKEAFPNTEELKEHKLKEHLGDCLKIKFIVFEEKFVHDAWTPLNRHSSSAPASHTLLPQETTNFQTKNQEERFQNPCVSLNRLQPTSISTPSRKRKIKAAQRPLNLSDESPALKPKRDKTFENDNKETPIPIPFIVPKEEPEEYDETETLERATASLFSSSFSSTSTEILHRDYKSNEIRYEDPLSVCATSTSDGINTDIVLHPFPFQTGQSNAGGLLPIDTTQETYFVELDPECEFECDSQSVGDEDSSAGVEYFNHPSISSSSLTPSSPTPEALSDAGSKAKVKPESQWDTEGDSEFEPESVSESESESEKESNSESESKKMKRQLQAHRARHIGDSMESERKTKQNKNTSSLPFRCSFCPKAFKLKYQLRRHRMDHPKSMPYKCSNLQCAFACGTQRSLLKHCLKHGKQQPGMKPNLELDLDLDLPLLQWLALQEEKNPSNIILLEPDPKSLESFQPVSEDNPVKCKWCQECYASELDLRWHVTKCFLYNKRRHLYCLECDKTISAHGHLRDHRNKFHPAKFVPTETSISPPNRESPVHTPTANFSCSYEQCPASFQTQKRLTSHMKEHMNLPKVDLNLDLPLFNWLLLQEESNPINQILLEPYPRSGTFPPVSEVHPVMCKWCEKQFHCEPDLRLHVANCFIFNKEKHRFCQECDRSLSSPSGLRNHNSVMHPTSPRPTFKCSVCSKEFVKENSFKFHLTTHEQQKGFESEDNGTLNETKEDEESQGKSQKKKPTYFQCRFCERSFMVRSYLEDHERGTHTRERPFKCDVPNCTKSYATKNSLFGHRKWKHMEELGLPGFLCTFCGKTYGGKSLLRTHIIIAHSESKRYKCTYDDSCTRSYNTRAEVDDHIRAHHTGEKPFQCDQCGTSYHLKSSLKKHIRTTHEGFQRKTVTCSLCPRQFKDNSYLKDHMKIHEGGRIFTCKICGLVSGRLDYLRRHEDSHRNDGAGGSGSGDGGENKKG